MTGSAVPVTPPRRGAWLLPREHGAYAEVGFPLFTAVALGRPTLAAICLVGAALAAFLLHEPVLVLIGRRGVRARAALETAARTRAAVLMATAVGLAIAGAWTASPWALRAVLALIPIGVAIGGLIAVKREKTWLGESLVAVFLCGMALPVADAAGAPRPTSVQATTVWVIGFLMATATVHAVIARTKGDRTKFLATTASAAFILLIGVGAALFAHPDPRLWLAAIAPPAMVSGAAITLRLSAKHLRQIGVALVGAYAFTAGVLIAGR